jgi:hypothetical protein
LIPSSAKKHNWMHKNVRSSYPMNKAQMCMMCAFIQRGWGYDQNIAESTTGIISPRFLPQSWYRCSSYYPHICSLGGSGLHYIQHTSNFCVHFLPMFQAK